MSGEIERVTAPKELQLKLFQPLFLGEDAEEQSRALDIYDLLPKFVFAKKRDREVAKVKVWREVKVDGREVVVTLKPALIDGGDKAKVIFPGEREELIERALRKLAVEQSAELGLEKTSTGKSYFVTVAFTLRQLRDRLAEDGHDFNAAQLREGLEVLRSCDLTVEGDLGANWIAEKRGPLLALPESIRPKFGDGEGSKTLYLGTFHPLASQAILAQAYFKINHKRIMGLSLPLARWIVTRLNLRFRQADPKHTANPKGYILTLSRILAESGIEPEKRLRDNIARVRAAINQLVDQGFLGGIMIPPPREELIYDKTQATRGRRRIANVKWTLYPSRSWAQEIFEDNFERKALREGRGSEARNSETLKLGDSEKRG